MPAIGKSNIIDVGFFDESRAIKRVNNIGYKVDDISIVDINNIRSVKISKLVKSKNLL